MSPLAIHCYSTMRCVLFTILLLPSLVVPAPCPFSDDCDCSLTDPPSATTFKSATCQPRIPGVPIFKGPDGAYTITGGLFVSSALYNIPARSFRVFKSIGSLNLEEVATLHPIAAEWDEFAFTDVQIEALSVKGLSGLLPTPAALKRLGLAGLKKLRLSECREPVSLAPNAFEEFKGLRILEIDKTSVPAMSPAAFHGLQGSLHELSLTAASLTAFPFDALNRLTSLSALTLTDAGIKSFSMNDFSPLISLSSLTLSGNNLTSAVESGALDNLPATVTRLILERGGLDSVPASAKGLRTLSLASNQIDRVKANDFDGGGNLERLDLSGNPISSVQEGSLGNLTSLQILDLAETNLESIDLSILNGMNQLRGLVLDDNSRLKSITVSSIDQVPPNLQVIRIVNGALESIDSKLGSVLDRPTFVQLNISNNDHLICQGSEWLAKYLFCDLPRLTADNTHCDNGTTLKEYLNAAVPNPCEGQKTTVSPGTDQTTGTAVVDVNGTTAATETTTAKGGSFTTANTFSVILAVVSLKAYL